MLLGMGCDNGNDTKHIYIISTNDIHATIEAMPKLATVVEEYESKGEVILVDSGDRVTGNAYVDDATHPGVPIIELMNEVGYDVVTLGNHEFDKGRSVLNTMVDASEFEWVCCNMEDVAGESKIKPRTTLSVAGVEICFVGVVDTDQDGRPLGGENSYVDFNFTPDVERASNISALPKSDFTVLLSHMGLERDIRLAQSTSTYDWIAGGHSHDIFNDAVAGTHISQNNKNIRYITIADLTVSDGAIVDVSYEQIKTAEISDNEPISALVEELKASDLELNTVEAMVTSPATKEGVSNFTIQSLATYPYADGFVPEITFYHYGGVRLDGFAEGDLKRVEILNNDPFVSTIYVGELTAQQIEEFILTKYNNGTPENVDKESHYPYFRSDMEYTIVLGVEPEERPDALYLKHNLESRSYRVALCNYVAENYIDKAIVEAQLYDTGTTVREAMLRYIRTFKEEGYTPDNVTRQHEVRAAELQ